MKKLITATAGLLFLMIVATSCTQSNSENVTNEKYGDIPVLLQRKQSQINGLQAEYELINTTYMKLKKAIEADANDFASRLDLAELFFVEARNTGEHEYYFGAALHLLDKLLVQQDRIKDEDIKFRATSLKASVLLSLHHFDEALKVGEQAILLNPYNAGAYGVLVDANVELGNYADAVLLSDKMVSIRPDLRSYSRISYLREIHGEVQGAIEAMKMAIEAGYPGYETTEWCRITLGHIYENYGNLDSAEWQYQTALQYRENYPFALAGLASVQEKRGEFTEAEKNLLQAIEVQPEESFLAQMADLKLAQGKTAESKEWADKALRQMNALQKEGVHVGMEYAHMILQLTGNADEAIENAMTEYSYRSANIDMNKVLAWAYYVKKDWAKAKDHMLKATATNSQNPELIAIAGLIKIKTGDEQEGKEWINAATKSNPFMHQSLLNEIATINQMAMNNPN